MLLHLWSRYNTLDAETQRRQRIAQSTWPAVGWTELPVEDSMLPRLFHGDGRAMPYVKDLFDFGCRKLPNSDIICYTNADIMVRSDAKLELVSRMQQTDSVYAYRRDFHHRVESPILDSDYSKGNDYPGSDLFAFRAGWWRTYRGEMPDMIVGYEAFDPVLRTLVDRTNPESDNCVRDIICHERHGSFWEHPANRYRLKGQLINLALAKQFLTRHGISPSVHGIL